MYLKKNKAQISVEYTIILGFVALMTVPLVLIYMQFTSDTNDEIISNQLFQIGQEIIDTSESVYYLGAPSQTVLKVHIPNKVTNSSIINEKTIIFEMRSKTGIIQVSRPSEINLTGSIPNKPGFYDVTIKAKDEEVEISYE